VFFFFAFCLCLSEMASDFDERFNKARAETRLLL